MTNTNNNERDSCIFVYKNENINQKNGSFKKTRKIKLKTACSDSHQDRKPFYRSQFSVPIACYFIGNDDYLPEHSERKYTGNELDSVFYTPRIIKELSKQNLPQSPISKCLLGRIPSIKTNKISSPKNFSKNEKNYETKELFPSDTILREIGNLNLPFCLIETSTIVSDSPPMSPELYDVHRKSSGASTFFAKEGFTPHRTTSAFYTPPTTTNRHLNNPATGIGLPAASLSISSQSPSLYLIAQEQTSPGIYSKPSYYGPIEIRIPSNPVNAFPITRENRKKAVITVDAKTTEILIASDNVCRLFALKDRSLIGRKLRDVFAGGEMPELFQISNSLFSFGRDQFESRPQIVNNALFSPTGKLTPVYGKPVDIIDSEGAISTVCVWSYPLTSTAALINQRKNSHVLHRSPSVVHLKNQKEVEKANAILRVTTSPTPKDYHNSLDISNGTKLESPRLVNHFHVGPESNQQTNLIKDEINNITRKSQSTCSPYSPYLKVLQEEQQRHQKISIIDSFENLDDDLDSEVLNAKFESDLEMREKFSKESNSSQSSSTTTTAETPDDEPDEKKINNLKKNGCIKESIKQKTIPNKLQKDDSQEGSSANRRWLILMEPISALHIDVILGAKGRIFRTDDSLATVLGYDCTNRLFGTEIHKLLPSLDLSSDFAGKEQCVCGVTIKKNGIPLSVVVHSEAFDGGPPMSYEIQIRSLASINGVVTITETGLLYSFNENFLHELLGKQPGTSSHCNEDGSCVLMITDVIPEFFTNMINDDDEEYLKSPKCTQKASTSSLPEALQEPGLLNEDELNELIIENEKQAKIHIIKTGIFYDLAKHCDGNLIPVCFEIAPLEMQSSPQLFAVCIGFDRNTDYGFSQLTGDEDDEDARSCSASSSRPTRISDDVDFNCTEKTEPKFSIGGCLLNKSDNEQNGNIQCNGSDVNFSLDALEDENNALVRGEYSKYYDTFQLIGNGAFGSVKLCARKENGLLAVTKFVNKSKVLPESWVKSEKRNRMVPIEVHLLETLNHPNIVKVLNVFENSQYYQLVMEKLGCGMDLFEFIDNQPKIDEPLISYIFRQIVFAVEYLHENHIVHRDLKDENVIIDQNFNCKLIDFGSAAYFGENIVFSTFCGTMEYCSPEVLTGNKYLGPELEMWSLGVLLYTVVFYENPFRTVEETIQAHIELPWSISEGLYQVLGWLLQPEPKLRATVTEIQNHWWVNQNVDLKKYKFQEMLKNCDRAQVVPPLYISDLAHHLKNASSCSNLANNSPITIEKNESGVVSAR